MGNSENAILNFLHLSEGLKKELRNGRTSNEKRESVADHTWRVTLMVLVFSKLLDQKICTERALKIAIVHDLAELITGDQPCFISDGNIEIQKEKYKNELQAMNYIKSTLPSIIGDEIFDLWKEYEDCETNEAKFVKAIDKIEAQIQHNEMNYIHWNDYDRKYAPNKLNKYCDYDSFLTKIKNLVQEESIKKINQFKE